MQHGKSNPEDIDPKKSLSDEGKRETQKIAIYLSEINLKPYEIIHSTKLRAKQTADIIAKILKIDNVKEVEGLNPLDDPGIWYEKIKNIENDIMIIGHLPHLSRLASLLLKSNEEIIKFRYSGVLCLEKEDSQYKIRWYITPDLIP